MFVVIYFNILGYPVSIVTRVIANAFQHAGRRNSRIAPT